MDLRESVGVLRMSNGKVLEVEAHPTLPNGPGGRPRGASNIKAGVLC